MSLGKDYANAVANKAYQVFLAMEESETLSVKSIKNLSMAMGSLALRVYEDEFNSAKEPAKKDENVG